LLLTPLGVCSHSIQRLYHHGFHSTAHQYCTHTRDCYISLRPCYDGDSLTGLHGLSQKDYDRIIDNLQRSSASTPQEHCHWTYWQTDLTPSSYSLKIHHPLPFTTRGLSPSTLAVILCCKASSISWKKCPLWFFHRCQRLLPPMMSPSLYMTSHSSHLHLTIPSSIHRNQNPLMIPMMTPMMIPMTNPMTNPNADSVTCCCQHEIKLYLGFSESRCFGLFQWFMGKCKSSKENTKIKMTADLTIVWCEIEDR